ncbi:hypothetical protein [Thalassiella azotivora]
MARRRSTAAAVGVAALLLASCGGDETVVGEAADEQADAVAILGEPVTIQAEVQEFVTPRVFVVGEGTVVIGGGDVPFAVGNEVQVTGTVRQLVVVDVEEDLGIDFADEEDEFLADYERQLVVVADEVEVLEI